MNILQFKLHFSLAFLFRIETYLLIFKLKKNVRVPIDFVLNKIEINNKFLYAVSAIQIS